jgi:hypothetical protein
MRELSKVPRVPLAIFSSTTTEKAEPLHHICSSNNTVSQIKLIGSAHGKAKLIRHSNEMKEQEVLGQPGTMSLRYEQHQYSNRCGNPYLGIVETSKQAKP